MTGSFAIMIPTLPRSCIVYTQHTYTANFCKTSNIICTLLYFYFYYLDVFELKNKVGHFHMSFEFKLKNLIPII